MIKSKIIIAALFIVAFTQLDYGYDNTQIIATDYNDVADTFYEVALPHTSVMGNWVKLYYGDQIAIVQVLDDGPQNTYDDYWNSGTNRDMFQNLLQWMPAAEWVLSSPQGGAESADGVLANRQPTPHRNFVGQSDYYVWE